MSDYNQLVVYSTVKIIDAWRNSFPFLSLICKQIHMHVHYIIYKIIKKNSISL